MLSHVSNLRYWDIGSGYWGQTLKAEDEEKHSSFRLWFGIYLGVIDFEKVETFNYT